MTRLLSFNLFLASLPVLFNRKFYVFGTGNTAMLYQEGFSRLNFEFEGYVTNHAEAGEIFAGKPVYKPADIVKIKNACVLICSSQQKVYAEVSKQLTDMDIEWYHIDEYIWGWHKEELQKVYDLLEDDGSKELYNKLLQHRALCILPATDMICPSQYFALPQFMTRDSKEVFVDCGAYVGDSLEKFIWQSEGVFKKIIAFEPDCRNYSAMQIRIERLKNEWNIASDRIETYLHAVGEKEKVAYVESYVQNNGLGSKIVGYKDENSFECKTVSLDTLIIDKYTFLKADVESYEYKMLLGAKESIKKWKPKVALSIYHNAVDFYSIPLLIKEINPEYKLAIRHHSSQLDDTVLYVWV